MKLPNTVYGKITSYDSCQDIRSRPCMFPSNLTCNFVEKQRERWRDKIDLETGWVFLPREDVQDGKEYIIVL